MIPVSGLTLLNAVLESRFRLQLHVRSFFFSFITHSLVQKFFLHLVVRSVNILIFVDVLEVDLNYLLQQYHLHY